MPYKILLVGACYLDTILTVPNYPAEDEKLRATSISHRRGGNVPNTAEVLDQLLAVFNVENVSLSMCLVLPVQSSQAVADIKQSLGDRIDFSTCIFREDAAEAAASYIVKSQETGSRTIVNYNPLREMTADEFISTVGKIGDDVLWCHFEGRIPEVALQCIRHLRENYPKTWISVEVEKPGRAGLEELAAEADVVFYSKSWAQVRFVRSFVPGKTIFVQPRSSLIAQYHGYQSAAACLNDQMGMSSQHRKLICCTWGSDGAVAVQRPQGGLAQCHGFEEQDCGVVDSIGAGDTFIAGMMFATTFDRSMLNLEQRLQFANELAGRKVTREGFTQLAQDMQKSGWELVKGSSSQTLGQLQRERTSGETMVT